MVMPAVVPEVMAATVAVEMHRSGASVAIRCVGCVPPAVVPEVMAATVAVDVHRPGAPAALHRMRIVPPGVVPEVVATAVAMVVAAGPFRDQATAHREEDHQSRRRNQDPHRLLSPASHSVTARGAEWRGKIIGSGISAGSVSRASRPPRPGRREDMGKGPARYRPTRKDLGLLSKSWRPYFPSLTSPATVTFFPLSPATSKPSLPISLV